MSAPLSGRQRELLADRLFQAAVENAAKAQNPPPPEHPTDYTALAAEHYAKAALALTQAYRTASQPCGTTK